LTLAPNDRVSLEMLPSGLGDGAYGIVSVEHDWDSTRGEFSVSFAALDAGATFRPMPISDRPSLVGATVGKVTGAPGDDIHTDDWGRAKVHFHWDRLQPPDDHCSDWIPTLQDNTGHSIGIPRVGWEVLVQHLEADPDRPVILGRLYTPEDDFHSLLPNNRMVSALRSLTSPRSPKGEETGENHVELLDLKGEEHIHFRAERDQVVLTEHDRTETTRERDARTVHGHEKITVGKSRHHDIALSINATIGTDQEVAIGHDRKVTVKKKLGETVEHDHSLTIGSTHMRRFETLEELHASSNLSESVGAVSLELCPQGNQASAGIGEAVLVGGAMIEVAKDGVAEDAAKAHVEIVGAVLSQQADKHLRIASSKQRTTTVGGNYVGHAGSEVLVSGAKSLTMTVGELILSAKEKLSLEVKKTSLILKGDEHAIAAPENVTVHADGPNNLNSKLAAQNDRADGGS